MQKRNQLILVLLMLAVVAWVINGISTKGNALDILKIYGHASIVMTILTYSIYLPSIFNGKTKPHIFTWFIYTFLSGVIFFIQLSSGAGPGAWALGLTTIICGLVTVLCLKFGTTDITLGDRITFILSLVAVIFWMFTSDAILTLSFILIAEVLAFYPTFRKTYSNPYQEPLLAYFTTATKMILSLAAIAEYNFYTAAYPIVCIILYIAFIMMSLLRRKFYNARILNG
ncbi:MAG: hypothetical protein PHX61_06825 [Alphaproteobacteria bacterium]|nr:hypothetical protein [Alphaproteobacteria bacterium]